MGAKKICLIYLNQINSGGFFEEVPDFSQKVLKD